MAQVQGQNFQQSVIVKNQMIPPEGPRCLPWLLDFTVNSSLSIDGSQVTALGKMSFIQGVFIDNSLNATAFVLLNQTSQQRVVCPPYSMGYFPVLASVPFNCVVTGASAALIPVYFYNIPIAPCVWSAKATAFNINGNGYLQTSDVALDAIISGNALRVYITTDIADAPLLYFSLSAAATTDIIASLGAQTRFFLNSVDLQLTPDAAMAVAGMNTWTLKEQGGNTLYSGTVYIPSASGAAGAAPLSPIKLLSLTDLNYKSQLDNAKLQFTIGTALTSGKFNITCGAVPYTPGQ